ncbi:lanthionine synthetase LanC family protein [Flavitalea sp. BT771]|uniref:lanthionine synthetase LanC family protein n=1 Tax=Flavitalea sp. BT771 TaxID=3063329 RepID=UPI0026E3DC65|nr:lanthionine synthetase LanC family protein [Flavitalea sp. BT771]MDO6434602.1 lanthionine synthetase LanC family protein [Flavitalea sp. BT771]MDV6223502.1 lanthionine synthetase LanC family protein [Flavitalea sp. BT771]
MLQTIDQAQPGTEELTRRYGHFLLGQMPLVTQFPSLQVPGQLPWNNPENIASGTGGIILLLLELYRQFGEEAYLRSADEAIQSLLAFCRQHPTNNYSLYTGRGGVFYVLIERYLIDKDKTILTDHLDLIRPANLEYLHSQYTPDALFDGRAGTLLILLHLYRYTGASFLPSYIGQFIYKILENATLSPKGLYWRRPEELNLGPVCGLAYGAAGIRCVLTQLHHLSPHPSFSFLLTETDRFIQSCRVEGSSTWGNYRKPMLDRKMEELWRQAYLRGDAGSLTPENDYGWADGTTGLLVAGCQGEAPDIPDGPLPGNMEAAGIYNGLAGLGLFLLATDDGRHTDKWQHLSVRLTDYLACETETSMNGGLLHGCPGIVYFLTLALRGAARSGNIVAPFLNIDRGEHLPELPGPTLAETRRILLSGVFPRSLRLWEEADASSAADYLKRSEGPGVAGELSAFITQLRHRVSMTGLLPTKDRWKDAFRLEHEKLQCLLTEQRSPLQLYLDKSLRQEKTAEWLNGSDEWLLQQALRISPAIKLVNTVWNWSKPDNTAAQYSEYILYTVPGNQVDEIYLTPDNMLLLHCFDEPCTVGHALQKIRAHIASIPQKELKEMVKAFTNFPTAAYFLEVMEKGTLFTIRQWVCADILSPALGN